MEPAGSDGHIGGVVARSISGWPPESTAKVVGFRLSHQSPPTHKNSCRNRSECDGYPMVGDSRFDEHSLYLWQSLGVVLLLITNYYIVITK